MFDKLVDFLISILDLFRCWVVVSEYETGILLRLGKFNKYLDTPGFYWKLPFKLDVEKVTNRSVDTALMTTKLLTLCDGKTNIAYTIGVNYNVIDPKLFWIETEDAEGSLVDSVSMEAAGILIDYTPDDLKTLDTREEIERKILAAGRRQCKNYGIRLNRLRFAEIVIGVRVYKLIDK
jgi:regulator of protease activity HflC (stomatin/prohibitin superfamily)